MPEISIETIGGGVIPERFDRELRRVLKNIADPNTHPKAKREITVKVTIKPSESREIASMTVSCSSKIAPVRDHETSLYFVTTRAASVGALANSLIT